MKHGRSIAIIPARGGSKRIPNKNIKIFYGKPIIAYSIVAALKSKCFDTVMVSTDDTAIARIAKRYGASVPFFRSEKNSNDHAHLADVIEEVLLSYTKAGQSFENFCCLLATAPFVTPALLKFSIKILHQKKADGIVPVVQYSNPIQRALTFKKGYLSMVNPSNYTKRSQNLPKAYYDAGQFYLLKTSEFIRVKKMYARKSLGIIIDEMQSQDIDSINDWRLAEMKYKLISKHIL